MKLRKNDYQDLRKSGLQAVEAKLKELRLDYAASTLKKMKNDLKDLRAPGNTRRAIARLMTISTELRRAK